MAVERAWHLIQTELPVSSWGKLASSHEFSLIDETGHFSFSLVPSGHHECMVMYRTDLDYSRELVQETVELLTADSSQGEK